MPESWRDVLGYEGRYRVSDMGRVYSVISGKVMKPAPSSTGRLAVSLRNLGRSRSHTIHSLVLSAFVGPRPDRAVICHKDGNHLNNSLQNLRYGTYSENQYDRVKHGTHSSSVKTHCPSGHPYRGNNLFNAPNGFDAAGIRKFKRACRICSREHARNYKSKMAGI